MLCRLKAGVKEVRESDSLGKQSGDHKMWVSGEVRDNNLE
jgi:hypothetical protein